MTEEIITFHLVPDIRKSFNKWAKEVGCSAKSRQLTREEQDKINKTRKSVRVKPRHENSGEPELVIERSSAVMRDSVGATPERSQQSNHSSNVSSTGSGKAVCWTCVSRSHRRRYQMLTFTLNHPLRRDSGRRSAWPSRFHEEAVEPEA